jgi:hypothetical protein
LRCSKVGDSLICQTRFGLNQALPKPTFWPQISMDCSLKNTLLPKSVQTVGCIRTQVARWAHAWESALCQSALRHASSQPVALPHHTQTIISVSIPFLILVGAVPFWIMVWLLFNRRSKRPRALWLVLLPESDIKLLANVSGTISRVISHGVGDPCSCRPLSLSSR